MIVNIKRNFRGSGKHFLYFEVMHSNEELCRDIGMFAGKQSINMMYCFPMGSYKENNKVVDRYVAIFPQLSINQNLVIKEACSCNKEVYTFNKSLNPEYLKWKSRLDYRLDKKLAQQIRDYDQWHGIDLVHFKIDEMLFYEGEEYIRGIAEIPKEYTDDITLKCYDSKLHTINRECVILRDQVTSDASCPDRCVREIQFLIKASKSKDSKYIIQAFMNDEPLQGFHVIDKDSLEDLEFKGSKYFLNAMNDPHYEDWFKDHSIMADDLEFQRNMSFEYEPKFSIIVPLYKTPIDLFEEMIASVFAQSYKNWELILVNASPEIKEIRLAVGELTASESRVKCIELGSNLGISENTNEGIRIATGDYIAFFDHDDLLEPDILFEYVKAINKERDIDVLYCDEDKIDKNGIHFCPNFKPDFSIDRLRNNNYICHMLTIKRELLDKLDGSTKIHDGAQDYNLTLQASEKASHIKHIPRILYHWRAMPGSTAMDAGSKTYTVKAGKVALQEHLDRIGLTGEVVESDVPNTYFVNYSIPDSNPLVSIIIPSKDEAKMLDRCIRSIIEKSSYDNYEILIIENNSTDPKTFEYYDVISGELPNVHVKKWDEEFNFSKIINFGVEQASGDYLLLLNNDTEVIADNWIELMLGYCQRPDVGAVGAKLLYPDDSIQHAGIAIVPACAEHIYIRAPEGYSGYFGLIDTPQNLSAVTAACVMTKRDVFNEVRGFNEKLTVGFNDIDYCLMLRDMGYLIVYDPRIKLYHYESISRGSDDKNKKKTERLIQEAGYMNNKWAKYYAYGDPYLNPNLHFNVMANESYMLKWS